MGTAAEKLIERYNPPFGLVPFILPRAYDTTAVEAEIPQLHRYPDKTKVMLRGVLQNFRVKHGGRITFIYADLRDDRGNKQVCQWAASGNTVQAKLYGLQSEAGTKSIHLTATITSFSGNEGSRVIFAANGKIARANDDEVSAYALPVYSLKQATKPYEIKREVADAIATCMGSQAMPDEFAAALGLPELETALKAVHGLAPIPHAEREAMAEMQTPWHRRITAELIYRTLKAVRGGRREGRSPRILYDRDAMRRLAATLPYDLTGDQLGALSAIFEVMGSGDFRRILLNADVGAGKTTVMGFAIFAALEAGHSAAMMAPSSVLAKQLYDEYSDLFASFDYPVFYAAKMTKNQRVKLQNRIQKAGACLVVGTIAVNALEIPDLALVLCDEEQKIGTEQKSALINGARGKLPYQILSSATPIPRSLASSLYGSVKSVRMKNRPGGRLPIFTKVVSDEGSAFRLFSLIRSEASKGNQALFVCPSIASGEMASIALAEELCEAFLPGTYDAIHGQMKPAVIDEKVAAFKRKEFSVLLATSMVDSGFHAEDLSVVVILSPERFGLSMLHQIRGRVGRRAGLQGYCALYPPNFILKVPAQERLDYFSKTQDGFELARRDLLARGSGELAGSVQSGGDVDFVENADLVEQIESIIAQKNAKSAA